ncbi:MAG: hypothetical protein ACYCYP_00665 [Leptospirales bacterium]
MIVRWKPIGFQVPHRNPFDHMLIAQSRIERLPILPLDPIFKECSIQSIQVDW